MRTDHAKRARLLIHTIPKYQQLPFSSFHDASQRINVSTWQLCYRTSPLVKREEGNLIIGEPVSDADGILNFASEIHGKYPTEDTR